MIILYTYTRESDHVDVFNQMDFFYLPIQYFRVRWMPLICKQRNLVNMLNLKLQGSWTATDKKGILSSKR